MPHVPIGQFKFQTRQPFSVRDERAAHRERRSANGLVFYSSRSFVLVEAGDEFTRQFYRSHFDVVDFTPVEIV